MKSTLLVKDATNNENQQLSFVNVDTKVLNKILANQIEEHKEIVHHNQVGYIPGMQNWLNIHKWITVIQHTNRYRDRNYVTILTDLENALNKVQYSFKTWRKNISQLLRATYNKHKAKISPINFKIWEEAKLSTLSSYSLY